MEFNEYKDSLLKKNNKKNQKKNQAQNEKNSK